MPRRLTPFTVLSLSLIALSAEAEGDRCTAPIYVWELQLEQVAADAGDPDLQSIATSLGTQATLRGGYFDPARPEEPIRVDLVGSTDGLGLTVRAERTK